MAASRFEEARTDALAATTFTSGGTSSLPSPNVPPRAETTPSSLPHFTPLMTRDTPFVTPAVRVSGVVAGLT